MCNILLSFKQTDVCSLTMVVGHQKHEEENIVMPHILLCVQTLVLQIKISSYLFGKVM
jgi:hypothetical protein